MILIVVLFSLIRPRNSLVYAPKLKYADEKHAPPILGKGLFDWTAPLLKIHQNDIADKVGLDATVFLRFTKMCRNMMLALCIPVCGIIMPTNLIKGGKSQFAKSVGAKGFWTISTPQYTTGNALWVHVIGAYLIDAIAIYFLWRSYVVIVRLKRKYFQSPEYLQSLHARTVMLTNIPAASRTDEGVLRLLDRVEQTSGIPRASVARNVKELPELIKQHDKTVRELESILAKYLKNPDRLPSRPTITPGKDARGVGRVDAIDYLMDRTLNLEMEIKHVRSSIDKRNPMAYGFAAYETIEEAHAVAYAARKKKPSGAVIELAPRPTDIVWQNLSLSKKDKTWKRFINNVWIVLLTVVWIAPNAMIAIFLSDLSNLSHIWPAFRKTYLADPKSWAVVQGIASPAITSLLYVLLPIAFRRLSMRAGDISRTSRERHVTQKLYAFFIFNNLIVFSAFSGVWAYVSTIVGTDQNKNLSVWERIQQENFFRTMLTALIGISPFWLTWLLQRNLGSAADLAQMIQLFWIWFGKTFTNPTPRQRIELTAPVPFDYSVYYNYFLFYATVALCFSTIQPMVVPIAAFFFVIDYWLKKYLLIYVLITKHESGGTIWRIIYNRFIFAIILANVIMALVIKAYGTWVMVACMAPLPVILIGFKIYTSNYYDAQIVYYTHSLLKSSSNNKDPENAHAAKLQRHSTDHHLLRKFGHPALHARLLTPMVHAKAAAALQTLYRGQHQNALDRPVAFSAQAGGTSNMPLGTSNGKDIPLHPLRPSHAATGSAGGSIAPATGKRGLFELVPEGKLDFGYFKHRTDFADEFGGDGELYGKASDAVSLHESSGGRDTPASFFRDRDRGSPGSSRASSPTGGFRSMSPASQQRAMAAGYRDHDRTPSGGQHGAQNQHQNPYSSPPVRPGSRPGLQTRNFSTESQNDLLRGAGTPGMSTPYHEGGPGGGGGYVGGGGGGYVGGGEGAQHGVQREVFGLDRWRTGGSGYVGLPGDAQGDGGAYDTYRGQGTGGGGGNGGGYESYRGGGGGGYESYRHG